MTEPAHLVTYLEFGPSFAAAAARGLPAWAASVRSETGVDEVMLLGEINRPERFALVETWSSLAQLNTRQTAGAHPDLAAAPGQCAPADERVGEPFCVGPARPAGPGALHVLIHIDVVPFNLAAVGDWLTDQAEAARPAALRYDVWRQVDRPNHFTAVQVWADRAAYAHHVENAITHAFRSKLLALKGALYDERLYRRMT
ncbi:MAG: antibiotic biosynthesis monooxygenase [Caulobacter sp.]|nr:antibiotic biosynthesis monooxygenase [Caulobacter sp.]